MYRKQNLKFDQRERRYRNAKIKKGFFVSFKTQKTQTQK